MGVVCPPWITKEWFNKCPFNYCDHFGNKEILAKVCKGEVERLEEYKEARQDPYDIKNVLADVAKDLLLARKFVIKDAERLGIDLNNLSEVEDNYPGSESYPIYGYIKRYGDLVEKIARDLQVVPIDADISLIEKVVDVLSHSRHYIIAKIGRAFLFAYISINRNCRALCALSRHKPLREYRKKFLKFAAVSLEINEMIKEGFFPKENLEYEERGCEEHDNCFGPVISYRRIN